VDQELFDHDVCILHCGNHSQGRSVFFMNVISVLFGGVSMTGDGAFLSAVCEVFRQVPGFTPEPAYDRPIEISIQAFQGGTGD
jgi:hypothetical protein